MSDAKWFRGGEVRLMAKSQGYVMCRKPGAMPFVLHASEWERLPDIEMGRSVHEQFEALRHAD